MTVIRKAVPLAIVSAWVFSLSACGGSSSGGPTYSVTVSGTVYVRISGVASSQDKLSDATAQISVNGSVLTTGTSNSEGAYTLTAAVPVGARAVVSFTKTGHAPQYRTLQTNAAGDLRLNVTMHLLETFSCRSGNCALEGNKLTVNGVPSDTTGSGRVFNPVTETSAFPGSFADNNGNLLISGVFSSVNLTSSGQPLRSMSQVTSAARAAAELGMKVPRDTWSIIQDVNAVTTDKVEVPLYAFDEAAGQWKLEGQGVLVDDTGAYINATTDLTAVKAGNWTKGVNATGDVTHFSYWNVDWPVETHTCITAQVLTAGGAPAVGAVVNVSGVSYVGNTSPQTTGAEGRFCADVMKSESGTTQTVRVTVYYEGEVYAFGPFDTSTTQATCDTAGCSDIGPLTLTEDKKLAVTTCTLKGRVVDIHGNPVDNAMVYAYDDSVPDAVYEAQCAADWTLCFPETTTTAGDFSAFKVLILEGATLWAFLSTDTGTEQILRYSQSELTSCPTSDVTITLSEGLTILSNFTVTVTGNLITWDPSSAKATILSVSSSTGDLKWYIWADPTSFASGVTYGTVPTGASQLLPTSGSPAPLASGDQVFVWITGTDSEGFPLYGSGIGTVP